MRISCRGGGLLGWASTTHHHCTAECNIFPTKIFKCLLLPWFILWKNALYRSLLLQRVKYWKGFVMPRRQLPGAYLPSPAAFVPSVTRPHCHLSLEKVSLVRNYQNYSQFLYIKKLPYHCSTCANGT